MKNNYDIKDDELRVIGKPLAAGNSSSGKAGKGYLWIVVAIVVVAIAGCILFFAGKDEQKDTEQGVFDEIPVQEVTISDNQHMARLGMEVDSLVQGFTEKIDTTINDIPLSIYIPHNATPELCLRTPDINDKSIVFCAQAADIRKDNTCAGAPAPRSFQPAPHPPARPAAPTWSPGQCRSPTTG